MKIANDDALLDGILSQFDFTDPDLDKKVDAFLHNAMDTMLNVMDYEQMVEISHFVQCGGLISSMSFGTANTGGAIPRSRFAPTKKGHRKGVLFVGGDKRDRTADLLNAIQALSQLSYTPIFVATSLTLSHLYCLVNPFVFYREKFFSKKC